MWLSANLVDDKSVDAVTTAASVFAQGYLATLPNKLIDWLLFGVAGTIIFTWQRRKHRRNAVDGISPDHRAFIRAVTRACAAIAALNVEEFRDAKSEIVARRGNIETQAILIRRVLTDDQLKKFDHYTSLLDDAVAAFSFYITAGMKTGEQFNLAGMAAVISTTRLGSIFPDGRRSLPMQTIARCYAELLSSVKFRLVGAGLLVGTKEAVEADNALREVIEKISTESGTRAF